MAITYVSYLKIEKICPICRQRVEMIKDGTVAEEHHRHSMILNRVTRCGGSGSVIMGKPITTATVTRVVQDQD